MVSHPCGMNPTLSAHGSVGQPDRVTMAFCLTSPMLARRCVLATDIERYSRRTAPDQHEAQRAYKFAMGQAAEDAGLDRAEWLVQPAGDGELAILPDGMVEPRVMGIFLPALAARLDGYNRTRLPEYRVRLRVAVHFGLVHLDGANGFPGPAPVVAARLLDARAVRLVLQRLSTVNVAAIVSPAIYQDIVVNRYGGTRPERFRMVHVVDTVKEFSMDAWVYAPEDDVNQIPVPPCPPSQTGRSAQSW